MKKSNCWEVKQCGREPGGSNVGELGVCPAATEAKLDGANDGRNAGRACWVITGTLCDREVQREFMYKLRNCKQCVFYKMVHLEEGERLTPLMELFDRLMADGSDEQKG